MPTLILRVLGHSPDAYIPNYTAQLVEAVRANAALFGYRLQLTGNMKCNDDAISILYFFQGYASLSSETGDGRTRRCIFLHVENAAALIDSHLRELQCTEDPADDSSSSESE